MLGLRPFLLFKTGLLLAIMYLEKLEIQGFKSFAYKNKLIFSGLIDGQKRGLTAIVGPNGSGKSNIADAVRWALGEQSSKILRGKKSEDVIFSGSDKKSQLGLAEVSLYLNNQANIKQTKKKLEKTDKDSNLDEIIKHCAEIVITRRIFRNGESEYLLNNNRVRLSDIQMLLAKAHFGQKTYSVIGQGMVDNFLNSSAAEKKDFFDEATGVKQFQIKRDSALNKLESSYENLQQVDMLLSEIKPRLRSLTRQMEKLKKREETERNLKQTQLKYYGYLWQDINKKLNSSNQQYLDLEKIKINKEKNLAGLNEELNRIRATDNFQKINELQPRWRELSEQKSHYQKRLAKLEIELETQLESKGQFDLSWLNSKTSELTTETENLSLEINSLEKSRPRQEEAALSTQLAEIDQEIATAGKIKQKIIELENEKRAQESKLVKLKATLEAQMEARQEFDSNELKNQQKEIVSSLAEIDQEINQLKLNDDENKSRKLKTDLSLIQEKIERLNQGLEEIKEKIKKTAKSEGKEKIISRLIKTFLTRLDEIDSVSDLKKAKKMIKEAKAEFQKEIKTVLTGESDEDAKRIQALQQNIIELTEKRQDINEKLNQINISQTQIKEKLNSWQEKKNRLHWELEDNKNKLEKCDINKEQDLKNEIDAQKQKIKVLEKERDNLTAKNKSYFWQEKKQKILEKLQNCHLKNSSISEKIKLLTEKKYKTETEIQDLQAKIKPGQAKFDASKIEQDKSELKERISHLSQEENNITSKLEKLNQAKEEEKNQIFYCQKKIQSLQQEINELSGHLNNLKIEAARQETRLEDLENNIRNDHLDIDEISNFKVDEIEINLDKWQKTINSDKNQLEQIGSIDEETKKEYEDTKERYDFLSGQTEDLDQAIKSLEQIIRELDANIKNRFDKEFQVILEKFNEYFQILFNGGSAKILKIMVEDLEKEENKNRKNLEDYIDAGLNKAEAEIKMAAEEKIKKIKFLKKYNAVGLAGIEVQATPPGKKIQSIAMLSGGERALTAIALICAIISANPSPFVVLDEVDAALDELNSEHLAKILDDLSDKTQFIIITHNRASMRQANILYGVTMQNDGVSQIISVKLDEINLNKKTSQQ
jgi:chromosome segregation protein